MNRGIMMNPNDNVCVIVSGTGVKAGEEVCVGECIIVANQDIGFTVKFLNDLSRKVTAVRPALRNCNRVSASCLALSRR